MLKYLFTCQYNDGTEFKQNINDISEKDSTRSAFFDIEHNKLIKFSITDNKNTFSVSLIDGYFEINHIPFKLHEEEINNIRLIFFRRHKHTFNPEQHKHNITYHIGFQANLLDGTNIKRVIEVE